MTRLSADNDLAKSKGQLIFEHIALITCLCVIALRATYTENTGLLIANPLLNISDMLFSLSFSAVLLCTVMVWFALTFIWQKFTYRYTAMEIPLLLFVIASVVAISVASNKRAAITGFVTLLAPVLMAVLLVQILDSSSKIKLVLMVIVALGIASVYQCTEQFFVSSRMMVEQYEQEPQSLLAPLGIEPGSFNHVLFEHRIYSRGIRGFFTTRNSAGSFALLAGCSAIALCVDRLKKRRSNPNRFKDSLLTLLPVIGIVFGLILTRSKGAIAAFVLAAAMFAAYFLFGNWLKAHKKAIFAACLLLVLAAGCIFIWYGVTHQKLPGGSSMLVRWQYWCASAKMYADHPLTGVGPGNFNSFYTHYKDPAALESVTDPHNFLLSILTQYGPLALAVFLAITFVPLTRVIFSHPAAPPPQAQKHKSNSNKLAVVSAVIISLVLLLIRPILIPIVEQTDSSIAMFYVVLSLYLAPVIAFAIAFWLLISPPASDNGTNINVIAVIFCAILGLLAHNLIDFAIFEPGIFTTFAAMLACLIALDRRQKNQPPLILKPAPFIRILFLAGPLLIIWAYFSFALIPVAKNTTQIKHAHLAYLNGRVKLTNALLLEASDDDRYDPIAPFLNGRHYLQAYFTAGQKQKDSLAKARNCLLTAVQRNKADFKNFELLTKIHTLLADTSTENKQNYWLSQAFDSAKRTVELYPGLARLRVKLAEIAEKLDKPQMAFENYKKAIEIEDSYRRQFQIMYPDRKIFSRLGEEKYQLAKQKLLRQESKK